MDPRQLVAVLWSAVWMVEMIYPAALSAVERSKGSPALPDTKCKITAPRTWMSQEQWVWGRVCRGEIADFNHAEYNGGQLDPKKAEGWSPNRVLSPGFLERILLHEPYRSALPHQGVRIVGGWFKEPLNLSNATLAQVLRLESSRFDADVKFIDFRSPYIISLDNSAFTGQLDMEGLQAGSSLSMNGANFSKVKLASAHIKGTLQMDSSVFTGDLDMDNLKVGGHLSMQDKTRFGVVILRGAKIDGALDMTGAVFASTLNMNSLKVGSHLFMRNEVHFDEVDLRGARIGGALDMDGSTFIKTLNMDSLKAGITLSMRKKARFSKVILRNAHVEGPILMTSSTFTGPLDMQGLRVDALLIMTDVTVTSTSPINLSFGKIAAGLHLSANDPLPSLNLTNAEIGGEFRLGLNDPLTWQPKAVLTLHNTTMTTVKILRDAWPGTLELDGFSYGSLEFHPISTSNMRNSEIVLFTGMLAKQLQYSPNCYEHLANVLEKAGRKDDARTIRYTSQERERNDAKGFQWWLLTGLKTTIGYGYRYQYALYWTMGCIAIGMLVLALSNIEPWGKKPTTLSQGISYTLGIFFYSLGKLLPIVKLDKRYDDPIPVNWVQYYFYIHQLIGYVLAFFLMAGLTGITK
jgi:hypothetical protein